MLRQKTPDSALKQKGEPWRYSLALAGTLATALLKGWRGCFFFRDYF
jgi:hypothetical protein